MCYTNWFSQGKFAISRREIAHKKCVLSVFFSKKQKHLNQFCAKKFLKKTPV